MLSKESLELLAQLFNKTSNLQLPVGLSEQNLEIRKWVEEQLKGN